MKHIKDADGRSLFDYSKRGEVKIFPQNSQHYKNWNGWSICRMKPWSKCTGKSISPEEIKSYFSTLAQARKKDLSKQAQTSTGTQLTNNNNSCPTAPQNLPSRNQEIELMSLHVPTLKVLYRERCLTVSGHKADLVQCIIAYDRAHTQQCKNDKNINL